MHAFHQGALPGARPADARDPAKPSILRRITSLIFVSEIFARFAIGIVIVGLIVAAGIAWFVDARVTDLMLAQTSDRAIDQVELGVEDHVSASDFEPPFTQAKFDAIATRLDPVLARLEENGVIRLNLIAPDGTIVYSDRPNVRGLQLPLDDELIVGALKGSAGRDVSALSGPENADLHSRFGGALEVYVPVTIRGRVVGVYEIYEDLASVRPLRPLVWGAVFGVLAPLLLVLVLVSRLVAKLTNREHLDRERRAQQTAEAEALRKLDRMKSDLLSAVSHELRGPLSLVHGYAELLVSRSSALDPEQVRQIAGEINRGSSMMARIVDDLLDFHRMEHGRLRLETKDADLVAVVRDTIDIFAQQRGAERIVVEAPRPVIVRADPMRLSQVIANLVSNAMRYAPDGPIAVRVFRSIDERAVLEVRDAGPGISPEALPHLWEMFYRAPEAVDSSIAGTGIGLALVKSLIEAHGGTVEAESGLNAGATFRVYLPAQLPSVLEIPPTVRDLVLSDRSTLRPNGIEAGVGV